MKNNKNKQMKAGLTLILFLFVSLILGAQDGYITDFKKKWKNATEYTLEMAELMPANKYGYKPTEEQRTFGEQLLHMVDNMNWLSSSHFKGEVLKKDTKKENLAKSEIIDILKEGFSLSSHAIDNISSDELNDKVDFFVSPMNKRQILTLMNDHLTHHRGQIIVYLRLQGITPPRYRGW